MRLGIENTALPSFLQGACPLHSEDCYVTASASCATNTDLALRCGRRLVRLNSPRQGPLSGSQPRAQATEELNKTQGDPSSRRDTKKKGQFSTSGVQLSVNWSWQGPSQNSAWQRRIKVRQRCHLIITLPHHLPHIRTPN